MINYGTTSMIKGSTCLAQSAATAQRCQSLALDNPRKAHHLSHHTRTYKQASTTNKKQYTNQCKQYKTRLPIYCTRYNDRVSARISKNGVKTRKLWLKHGSKGLSAINWKEKGLWVKKLGI